MSEKRDVIVYLNAPDDPQQALFSRLQREIEQTKQARAPASQWIAMIRAFTQKGVKQLEIDETEILERLGAGDPTRVMTREEVAALVRDSFVTIKQVTLANPKWASYRWPGGEYFETLFILNSKRDNVTDRIEAIEFELEQLNFDLDRLMEAIPLDEERKRLKSMLGSVPDFSAHHFSDAVEGKHGKNLMAHARYTLRGDTFFIEEIQSDWAQKGRRNNWQGIPKGPYVTSTELWAGLVMRRLMQMAARSRAVRQIAWITGDMRNGGRVGGNDGLNDFYAKIIPKLCEKTTGKLGRVTLREFSFADGVVKTVPGIDLSPELKEKLAGELPLYSHGFISPEPEHDHLRLAARAALLTERFGRLTGSTDALRLCSGLIDDALYAQPADDLVNAPADRPAQASDRLEGVTGKYTRGLVQVSLQAEDPLSVLDHESFHLVYDRLLFDSERRVLADAFNLGGALSREVHEQVGRRFGTRAQRSCEASLEETCAYAFQLWARGDLQLGPQASERFAPARSFFGRMRDAIASVWRYVRGERDAGFDTPAKIFSNLRQGVIAHERAQEEAPSEAPTPTC